MKQVLNKQRSLKKDFYLLFISINKQYQRISKSESLWTVPFYIRIWFNFYIVEY